jgi:hypothetical protein
MRPRERLLRRGINPNDENAIRKALEAWSDWLSTWEHVFTGAVVAGLIIEYLSEITSFFSKPIATTLRAHDPQLREWGGLFVILGVAGELMIGVRSSRVETDLREESNSVLAQANERAANAERQAAEANLARVKIEQRMKRRFLSNEDLKALLDIVAPYARRSVDIIVFDHHEPETLNFARQLTRVFTSANWVVREWESRKVAYRIPGSSMLIAMAAEHVTSDALKLAQGISDVLTAIDIDCGISPGSFGCKGEFEPGDFQMRFQHPTVMMGVRGVAPFRIQIGAKQLSPLPPPRIFIGTPGKSAPPET